MWRDLLIVLIAAMAGALLFLIAFSAWRLIRTAVRSILGRDWLRIGSPLRISTGTNGRQKVQHESSTHQSGHAPVEPTSGER